MKKRQMAVALYFLDKLALRAGHEKEEDEADTVGCCTLKVRGVMGCCTPENGERLLTGGVLGARAGPRGGGGARYRGLLQGQGVDY